MQPVLRANAQSVFAHDLGNFRHWTGCLESQIADNDERFIDQNSRAPFQPRERYARIDVAIIIGAANYDVRGLLRSGTEKGADPIRFAGEVTFLTTSSSFSIIRRASTIVSC